MVLIPYRMMSVGFLDFEGISVPFLASSYMGLSIIELIFDVGYQWNLLISPVKPRVLSMQSSSTANFLPSSSASFKPSGQTEQAFVDRRQTKTESQSGGERRQFGSTHLDLSDDGRELAVAIDMYKLQNHRRYITCDEMLLVLKSLGYTKS